MLDLDVLFLEGGGGGGGVADLDVFFLQGGGGGGGVLDLFMALGRTDLGCGMVPRRGPRLRTRRSN